MPTAGAQLRHAAGLLQQRRADAARRVLQDLLAQFPHDTEAARLLAAAQLELGAIDAAVATLKDALRIAPQQADLHAALGEVLLRAGDELAAERALREAVQCDPSQPAPWLTLLRSLRERGCLDAALACARHLVALLPRTTAAHGELARTLAAAGRFDEALASHRQAATLAPGQPAAQLQLALGLLEADRHAEAEAVLRALQRAGLDAPELRFALARAALGQERWDEAEAQFCHAIRQRPDYLAAHADLAQMRWMRNGDVAAASAEIDRVLRAQPTLSALRATKAGLYRNAGESGVAYAQLREALLQQPDDPELLLAVADTALVLDATAALAHAERAAALLPQDAGVLCTLGNAQLACGEAQAALATAQRLLERNADDQQALAMLASAQRLAGGARTPELADYGDVVRASTIDVPPGWADLPSYLHDLAAALRRLHTTREHPLGQTLRQGTQTQRDLRRENDPAIRAFVQAIDGPIRRHLAALGQGDGPLRRRNRGGYRIRGMWSVQLRPHGFHVDHFHPEGWLSSACYIDLPATMAQDGEHAGWIKFGESGVRTQPALPPEHFVQPRPGLLVLFPSYLWHGTVPFAGAPGETRLTIAFDLVPE